MGIDLLEPALQNHGVRLTLRVGPAKGNRRLDAGYNFDQVPRLDRTFELLHHQQCAQELILAPGWRQALSRFEVKNTQHNVEKLIGSLWYCGQLQMLFDLIDIGHQDALDLRDET